MEALINGRKYIGNWVYKPTYRAYNSIYNWLGPTLQYPCPFLHAFRMDGCSPGPNVQVSSKSPCPGNLY